MATMYYDKDADLSLLKNLTVAVLGYGSQGHAHAQNLKDSGVSVIIGLHEGSRSKAKAEQDGFTVLPVAEAAARGDVVMFLMPDHIQAQVYTEHVRPNLKKGAALAFAHGFTVHFHQVVPPTENDVFMIAPKGPGHLVRRMYQEGKGVPGLIAIYQNASGKAREIGLAYASGIGCCRAGVIETTFEEETETDLFGEQAVLCGGVTELIKAGFETLVEAGYQPEIAYFECLNEMKLIVDLLFEGGLEWMRYSISDTAEYGDCIAGPKVIGEPSRKAMKELLKNVQSGAFAREWIMENQTNRPVLKAWRRRESQQLLETVGKELRTMMPWMEAKEAPRIK